jgi:DNA-binding CsgD family transcriptional regulator
MGHVAEAEQAFALGAASYHDVDHHAGVAFTVLNRLHGTVMPYDTTNRALRAQLSAEAEAALQRSSGALPPDISPSLGRIACLFLDGDWDQVRAILRQSAVPGNSLLRREVTGTLATLARHEGNPTVAWAQISSLLPDGPQTPPGGLIFSEALHLLRLAADLALDAGDLAAAKSWLAAHDRWLAWSRSVPGYADGLVAWARYHVAAGDMDEAKACATEALTAATIPDQPLVLLAAHQVLGGLAVDQGQWSIAADHLVTALDIAGACAAPFYQAQTLIVLASLRLAEGRRGDAESLLTEAKTIAGRLGATRLLAAAESLSDRLAAESDEVPALPAGLTLREVEVLRLVAQGLTDGAIAERLFISPRTVSQHLRSIYGKLAVSSRAAATRIAVELRLL